MVPQVTAHGEHEVAYIVSASVSSSGLSLNSFFIPRGVKALMRLRNDINRHKDRIGGGGGGDLGSVLFLFALLGGGFAVLFCLD